MPHHIRDAWTAKPTPFARTRSRGRLDAEMPTSTERRDHRLPKLARCDDHVAATEVRARRYDHVVEAGEQVSNTTTSFERSLFARRMCRHGDIDLRRFDARAWED